MKNFLQKLFVLIFTLIIAVGCVACGGGSNEKYDSKDPQTLDVYYWSSGNGKEYMAKILEAFKAKNPDININYTPSSSVEGKDIYQDPDNVTTDIYFTTMSSYMARTQFLEPLNSVLEMETDGVKVSSRFDESTINSMKASDGNIYSLPWSNSVTGFVYNATLFEEKGWKVPKTTDEFVTLCANIFSAGLTPFIQYADYWDYPILTWMAQYAGVENFNKYWKGVYTDENGVEKFNDISLFRDNEAKEQALKVLPDLLSPKGYTVTGTNSLSHTIAQTKFLAGQGVIMPNGSWMENEMKNSSSKYTFKMMKYPVISALGEELGIDEDQLRALIAYVDGDATADEIAYAESVDTVILERVREARNIVYTERLQYHVLIPKNSPAKEAAKKLLAFYYSDEALEIAETTCGMILPVTYGDGTTRKHPDDDTAFLKSCSDIIKLNGKVIERTYSVPIFYNTGIEKFWHYDAVRKFTYISKDTPVTSYQKFMEDENKYWTNNWNDILTDAGL